MEVIAIATGFSGGYRRKVGARFDLAESDMKTDVKGNPVLPKWVVPADEDAVEQIARVQKEDKLKEVGSVIAAAGPKRPGVVGVRSVQTGYASAVEDADLV